MDNISFILSGIDHCHIANIIKYFFFILSINIMLTNVKEIELLQVHEIEYKCMHTNSDMTLYARKVFNRNFDVVGVIKETEYL